MSEAWGVSVFLGLIYALFWLVVIGGPVYLIVKFIIRMCKPVTPEDIAEMRKFEEDSKGGPIFYDRYPFF